MTRKTLTGTAVAAAVLVAYGALLIAGPLDPPAGPVASTHKTLTEVEPRIAINAVNTPGDADSTYRITLSGSYYLTANTIISAANKHGIEIAASGVTLDLNGFILAGPIGADFDGITVSVAGLRNIEVRGGTISGFGGDGIDFRTMQAAACVVQDVRARSNVGSGIRVGPASTVADCTAYENAADGISADAGCTISACLASANGAEGIRGLSSSTIAQCTANINGGSGISVVANSTISGCTASNNASHGIAAGSFSTISDCTSRNNDGHGISLDSNCTVSSATVSGSGGNGLSASNGCTITGCSASFSGGHGIDAGSANTITGCTAESNTLNGVRVVSRCVVAGNTCSLNGVTPGDGAGIHVLGDNNRIEANNCTSSDRGIDVDGSLNILIRNTCGNNTVNWSIALGNSYGQIVDAAPGAAVSGNTAASTLGTTDSNANFTY